MDFSELLCGLSILCGGEEEDKIEAAFALFDADGNGYVSMDEMSQYLSSVFRVVFEMQVNNALPISLPPTLPPSHTHSRFTHFTYSLHSLPSR